MYRTKKNKEILIPTSNLNFSVGNAHKNSDF